MRILPFASRYPLALQQLVTVHLSAAVPGWTLSADYLAQHLEYDDTEGITEPWVTERRTLLAARGHGNAGRTGIPLPDQVRTSTRHGSP